MAVDDLVRKLMNASTEHMATLGIDDVVRAILEYTAKAKTKGKVAMERGTRAQQHASLDPKARAYVESGNPTERQKYTRLKDLERTMAHALVFDLVRALLRPFLLNDHGFVSCSLTEEEWNNWKKGKKRKASTGSSSSAGQWQPPAGATRGGSYAPTYGGSSASSWQPPPPWQQSWTSEDWRNWHQKGGKGGKGGEGWHGWQGWQGWQGRRNW